MEVKELVDQVCKFAEECGLQLRTSDETKGNAILRNNTKDQKSKPDEYLKGGYFGFVREDEGHSGAYHDFSLVFMPQIDNKACLVLLGVGSLGFANDVAISQLPWIRRVFTNLRNSGGKTFYKSDFSDNETPCSDLLSYIKDKYPQLKQVVERYKKEIQASTVLDYEKQTDKENFEIIKHWIATYAYIRGWGKLKAQNKTIEKYLPSSQTKNMSDGDIMKILKSERFIVLQGAPGTGKTFTANKIAKTFKNGHVFFEQFHAETTYSDFVYGIIPKLDSENLVYKKNEGVLYRAIKKAKDTKEDVLLIIDEINRANLSNVLGPVFYLFEKKQDERIAGVTIGGEEIKKLPDNLYVVATMNTADRSLAVVDFALRRRFVWITLKPQVLEEQDFYKKEFEVFDRIFKKYATDEELNLQPGHSYFLADSEEQMNQRLQYELMPLIKEYINEGYIIKAKDEFSNYFYNKLGVIMYE